MTFLEKDGFVYGRGGTQGFFSDRDDVRAHGRDERMPVESFYEGQAYLYELVKTLANTGI